MIHFRFFGHTDSKQAQAEKEVHRKLADDKFDLV
jgi:hypothetical protein